MTNNIYINIIVLHEYRGSYYDGIINKKHSKFILNITRKILKLDQYNKNKFLSYILFFYDNIEEINMTGKKSFGNNLNKYKILIKDLFINFKKSIEKKKIILPGLNNNKSQITKKLKIFKNKTKKILGYNINIYKYKNNINNTNINIILNNNNNYNNNNNNINILNKNSNMINDYNNKLMVSQKIKGHNDIEYIKLNSKNKLLAYNFHIKLYKLYKKYKLINDDKLINKILKNIKYNILNNYNPKYIYNIYDNNLLSTNKILSILLSMNLSKNNNFNDIKDNIKNNINDLILKYINDIVNNNNNNNKIIKYKKNILNYVLLKENTYKLSNNKSLNYNKYKLLKLYLKNLYYFFNEYNNNDNDNDIMIKIKFKNLIKDKYKSNFYIKKNMNNYIDESINYIKNKKMKSINYLINYINFIIDKKKNILSIRINENLMMAQNFIYTLINNNKNNKNNKLKKNYIFNNNIENINNIKILFIKKIYTILDIFELLNKYTTINNYYNYNNYEDMNILTIIIDKIINNLNYIKKKCDNLTNQLDIQRLFSIIKNVYMKEMSIYLIKELYNIIKINKNLINNNNNNRNNKK